MGANNQSNGQKRNNNGRFKFSFNINWIFAIIAIVLLVASFWNTGEGMKEIDNNDLRRMVVNHDVDKIVVVKKDEQAEIYIKKDKLKGDTAYSKLKNANPAEAQFYYPISSVDGFMDELRLLEDEALKKDTVGKTVAEKSRLVEQQEHITVRTDNSKDWGGTFFSWLLFPLLLLVFFFFMMRSATKGSGGAGIFNIGKSPGKLVDASKVPVTFKDVAGLEGAKEEVMEIVDFLKNPNRYTELGGKIPKGALLVGPPGTGKTLLARAVAGEAKVPFFSLSGSDFVEMFVGVGASRVRDLFKTAKEKAPCIIFIDEIDAIGRARGRNSYIGSNDERESTLNQLLTEMDGFSTNTGVIILAATNRADVLDMALLRPGRFDRQIHVELPDVDERKAIFQVHMRNLKLGENVDLDFLSKQTPGFSGADIANVCNEAALIAARKSKKQIEKQDFLDAVDRIIGGLERRSKIISAEEKKVIAYHEAGHAVVSWMLQYASPLVKVTIVPRGKSLGAAWYLPEERQITTTEQMLDEITATLGGRAAEEVTFGKISTGALNDLERTSKQAYAMVAYYGLNPRIGNISYYDSTGQEYSFNKPFSEQTAQVIDEEIHKLIEDAYVRAKQILLEHKEGLQQLAELLLEREVIFREDVESIFGKRPWPDKHVLEEKATDEKQAESETTTDSEQQEQSENLTSNEDNE